MTREQLKERWPIMQAFLDGKRVEYRSGCTKGDCWIEIEDAMVILTPELEVRIAPEKPKSISPIGDRLESLRKQVSVQGSNGNWNHDPYMHGMFNGLECALATIEQREPNYRSAPTKWLADKIAPGFATTSDAPSEKPREPREVWVAEFNGDILGIGAWISKGDSSTNFGPLIRCLRFREVIEGDSLVDPRTGREETGHT